MPVTVRDIIAIPISRAAIDRAAYTAGKKFANTMEGFQTRPPIQILDDTFRGDLAKLVVIEHLTNNGVGGIIDYDRVRIDNFTDPNSCEWHFRTARARVEVNSSVRTSGYSQQGVINSFDIKVNAGDDYTTILPLEHPYDIAVQVYYDCVPRRPRYYDRNDIMRQINVDDTRISAAVINMLDLYGRFEGSHIYGYAWNTIEEVENIRQCNIRNGIEPTWTFNGADRRYWKCPISTSQVFSTLSLNV